MSARADDVKQSASEAIKDPKKLEEAIAGLSDPSRRQRQNAAAILAEVSREDASLLVPSAGLLVGALEHPEAQTRWEALDALTQIVPLDSRTCDKAIPEAETALFDEDSGPLHLSAMRFLCKLGSTTENRSEKVWGLIDEAIQCYHGDVEFNGMLLALIDFSAGTLSPQVKKELAARMKFDAENGKGTLKKRASQIEDNLK